MCDVLSRPSSGRVFSFGKWRGLEDPGLRAAFLRAAAGRPGDRSEPGHSSELPSRCSDEGPTDASGPRRLLFNAPGGVPHSERPPESLLADAQPFDELPIPRGILRLQVVEESSALPDQLEQPAARMVVLLVGLEVLGQILDALGQERDLDLGRAGVALVRPELLDHTLLLRFVVQRPCAHHFSVIPTLLRRPGGRASRRSIRALLPGRARTLPAGPDGVKSAKGPRVRRFTGTASRAACHDRITDSAGSDGGSAVPAPGSSNQHRGP